MKRVIPRLPSRGFTLIELLTVIAIIGILASILIPVVGRVRQSARASVDLSNMRQLGTAMLLYAEDNKNKINVVAIYGGDDQWGRNYWTRAAPYLSSKLAQANFGTATVRGLTESLVNRTLPEEYLGAYLGIARSLFFATNKRLLPQSAGSPVENHFRQLSAYPSPSQTPYIAVGKWGFVNGTPGALPTPVPSEGVFWPYAGNRTIAVYLDGHAAFRGNEFTLEECYAGGPRN